MIKRTTVQRVLTATAILCGGRDIRTAPKHDRLRVWAANQIRGTRAHYRRHFDADRGLPSVGMAGLRR